MSKGQNILIGVIFILAGVFSLVGAIESLTTPAYRYGPPDYQTGIFFLALGIVLSTLGAFVIRAALRRSAQISIKCPNCGGAKVIKMVESKRLDFFIKTPMACTECNHAWEPPTSLWILVIGLVASSLVTILGVVIVFHGFIHRSNQQLTDLGLGDLISMVIGIVFMIGGPWVVVGYLRRIKMSEKGKIKPFQRYDVDVLNDVVINKKNREEIKDNNGDS